jgi:hypothetical protein
MKFTPFKIFFLAFDQSKQKCIYKFGISKGLVADLLKISKRNLERSQYKISWRDRSHFSKKILHDRVLMILCVHRDLMKISMREMV